LHQAANVFNVFERGENLLQMVCKGGISTMRNGRRIRHEFVVNNLSEHAYIDLF